MHTLSLRSFLLLCAFAFACLQALTIPEQHRSSLALRDLKLGTSVEPLDLDRRAKKPPTKPPPPPPPPPKSKPPPPPPPPTSKAAPPPPPPSSAPPPPPPPSSAPPPPPPPSSVPPPPPASSNPPPPPSSNPPKSSASSVLNATPASSIASSASIVVSSTSIPGSTLSSAVSSSSSTVSSISASSSASSDSLSPSASTILSTTSVSLTSASPSAGSSSSSFDSSSSTFTISGSPTASGSVSLSSASSSVDSSISASTISGSITSSASISDSTSLSSTSTISSSSSVVIDYVHPTTAVNTCDLLGVDCYKEWDEFDGVFDDSDETNSTAPFANNTRRALTKRGDRDFKADIPPVGTLAFQSLGYPGPKVLFTGRNGAGVSAHSFSFKSNDLDDFSIKDFNNPSNPGDYVVEHIIELQSIKLFIEAAVGAPGSTIKLSKTVPAQFFQDWWTVTLDANDVATRSQPNIKQANFADKERTLNNLIFQSLGSSYNRADFVLCQPEINSYKKSVWIGESPMGDKRFQAYADDVAIGGADERDHLSALRTTLAVYSYLNHAEVKSRLQSAIANVKTELSNVKHLTKEDHDLAGLWVEFMSALLLRTEKNGRDWLTKSITYSNNAYQKELDNLLALQKNLKPDAQLTQAEKLARDQKIATLTKERTTLDQAARKADKDVEDSEKRLNGYTSDVAAAKAKKNAAAENAAKTKRDAEKKVLEQAKIAKYEADKKVNLKNREMHVLYRQVLDKIIDAIKKDMKTLDGYSAATKKISMPSAT